MSKVTRDSSGTSTTSHDENFTDDDGDDDDISSFDDDSLMVHYDSAIPVTASVARVEDSTSVHYENSVAASPRHVATTTVAVHNEVSPPVNQDSEDDSASLHYENAVTCVEEVIWVD